MCKQCFSFPADSVHRGRVTKTGGRSMPKQASKQAKPFIRTFFVFVSVSARIDQSVFEQVMERKTK